jgi:hypothetical protein
MKIYPTWKLYDTSNSDGFTTNSFPWNLILNVFTFFPYNLLKNPCLPLSVRMKWLAFLDKSAIHLHPEFCRSRHTITNVTRYSSSWEANDCPSGQEMCHFFHRNPTLICILSQMNPVHIIAPISILYSHLSQHLQCGFFLQVSQIKFCTHFSQIS